MLAYVGALVVVAPLAAIVVLVIAGPHSGLLPSWLEAVVLALGWLAVLVVPVWAARKLWVRLGEAGSGDEARVDGEGKYGV